MILRELRLQNTEIHLYMEGRHFLILREYKDVHAEIQLKMRPASHLCS